MDDESVQDGMDDTTNTPATDRPTSPNTLTGDDTTAGVVTAPPPDSTLRDIATEDTPVTVRPDGDTESTARGPVGPGELTPAARATGGAARTTERRTRNSDGALFFIGAIVAAILGSLLTLGILALTGTFDDAPVTVDAAPPATVVETNQPTIINDVGAAVNPTAVASKVIPSVVTVLVGEGGADAVPTGSGSGVVMSSDGYIITNHHVVEDGDTYSVTFEDGREYDAQLVGSDDLTDLAVLKISADGLVPVEFGSADALAIGDPAVAIGNPLGQTGGASITSGIISAFDRRVDFSDGTALFGMIQTDAAINSGSSGGALVDAEGRLIGITSAIGVSQAGPEGIGYAIPIELVDRITAEIIETGDVQHPFMGVQMQTYFDTADDGATVPAGAIIEAIESTGGTSAAGDAGMEPGDIVVAINGEPITTQSDLILDVRLYRVGDVVTFTVDRAGERLDFDVTLGQRPAEFQG